VIRLREDGKTVQLDLVSLITTSSRRVDIEEEVLRRELRRVYHDKEELMDIAVRLRRKHYHRMTVEEIENEVIELSRDFLKERHERARSKLAELMGG